MASLARTILARWRHEAAPPRRGLGIVFSALLALGLLVPLVGVTSSLPKTASPAACVSGPTQAATSGDSFFAVPSTTNGPGLVYTYDATSGAPLGSPIEVGYDPVSMAVDTTYGQLYVLNQGYAGVDPPSVSVIDYESGFTVATTISTGFPTGSAPATIAVSPGGNHVVIADPGSDELLMINPQDLSANIVGHVALSGPPSDLAFPGGEPYSLYAGDTTNDRIYVLGLATPSAAPYYALDSTTSGEDPTSLASAGTTLYVGNAAAAKVDLFTTGWTDNNGVYTGTLSPDGTSYATPNNAPDHLALTPSGGTLYVSSGTTSFLSINTVSAVETEETVPGNAGDAGGTMAVNADGSVLEFADTNEYWVGRWAINDDVAQDPATESSSYVQNYPSAVASVPAGSMRFYAYVAQSAAVNGDGTGDVSVIDLLANADIADLPVGANPEAVLPSPDGSSVYVAGTGTGTNGSLKVIDTAEINTPTNPVTNVSTNPAIPFSSGAWPNALAFSPSGDELLVSDYSRGVVYDVELNTASPHTMTTIYLDGAGTTSTYDPVAIAMDPNGRYAYVTDHNHRAITVLESSAPGQPFTLDQTIVPTSPNSVYLSSSEQSMASSTMSMPFGAPA